MVHSCSFNWTIGVLAALGSAATFALCSILLQKISLKISPLGANFSKSVIGSIILLFALLLIGTNKISASSFIFLGFSGLLGIALGDTFFFKALVLLGPRLTLLLETLGPIFTIILAITFLKETQPPLTCIGILLTLSGVTWVILEKTTKDTLKDNWKKGIKYALLFVFCMSLGTIFTKVGVKETSALQATFIRMLCSSISLFIYGLLSKNLINWIKPFKDPNLIKIGISSLILAIFGGFWLSTVALKYIDASIAIVLNSTTPIFILPLVAIFSKEKISPRSALGAVIAVLGIAIIFLKQ